MTIHQLPPRPAEVELHTDCPGSTDEVLIAYEAVLPATDGDRTAAAILAVGAVIADALNRRKV